MDFAASLTGRPAILLPAVLSLNQTLNFADEAAPAAASIPAGLRGPWRVMVSWWALAWNCNG